VARSQGQINEKMSVGLIGEPGLMGYWDCNETQGNTLYDISGHGYDGTLMGSTTWSVNAPAIAEHIPGDTSGDEGPFSLSLDGSDNHVEIPYGSNMIANSDQITVSGWVYPRNSDTVWPDYDGYFGIRNESDADFYVLQLSDYKLEARMRTANRQVYTITTAENAVSTETWHHVALSFDGDSLRLYIDGNQAGITPASGEITNTQETFKIGSLDFAGLYQFDLDGQVDEVRVWTIARSQQEIMDGMYAVLDGNEDGLAGYWGFDEGYGNMVQDLSGNGYDGTIVGAANWSENVPTESDAARVVFADEIEPLPETFALHQNYPNPFNPVTTINYDLPEPGRVHIVIYDILGKQVRTLVNGHQDAGYRSIQWNGTSDNGRRAAAGMYIYLIQTRDFVQSHKMTLLK